MNIVCSIDNNYVEHCCVMLCSFLTNNKDEQNTIFLLGDNLTSKNQAIINDLVHSFNGKFVYCQVDADALKDCPIKETDHLTIATYYRLFMAKVLPKEIDKVLYLDCDIVIDGSLKELWNTNLDNYALAGIEEMGWHSNDVFERLGFDKKYGYFNAGVILVNLKYWREQHLTEKFVDYLALNSARLKAHDQDVLNAVLHNKSLHVSCKWNVETGFCLHEFLKIHNFDPQLLRIIRKPIIIHYTWKPKPWEKKSKHPFRIVYYKYYNKLPMKELFGRTLTFEKHLRLYWYKFYFKLLLTFSVKNAKYYKM
ncbi:glycosyltransferase family 8 protein [uncultured Bacteroides sp.]|uniref:glycosyltransferase family 8 protein n=1 Tax=uncultured Bacteroides sp. TaxID=162156 RepID=UPI0025E60211|nr:glycosyltransferase family 8 protein [uncultured Bacteroides sp.]